MNTDKLDTLITFLESQSKDAVVTAWDLAIVLKELKEVFKEGEDGRTDINL